MDIFESLKSLKDVYVNFPKVHAEAQEELKLLDKEANDLLHLCELTDLSASEGYKFYKDLQRNRKERRKVKDLIELLGPVLELNRLSKPSAKNIDKFIGEAKNITEKHKARSYRMRVREDLQDKI